MLASCFHQVDIVCLSFSPPVMFVYCTVLKEVKVSTDFFHRLLSH